MNVRKKKNFVSILLESLSKFIKYTPSLSLDRLPTPFLAFLNPIYIYNIKTKRRKRDKNATIHFQITKKKKKEGEKWRTGDEKKAKGWKRDKNLSSNSHDPRAHPRRERFLRGPTNWKGLRLFRKFFAVERITVQIKKEHRTIRIYLICIYIYISFSAGCALLMRGRARGMSKQRDWWQVKGQGDLLSGINRGGFIHPLAGCRQKEASYSKEHGGWRKHG